MCLGETGREKGGAFSCPVALALKKRHLRTEQPIYGMKRDRWNVCILVCPSAWHGYCYYRKVRTSGYGPEGRARRCRPIWLLLPETRNRTESRSTLARGCSSPEGRIRLRCTWRTIVTTDLTCLTRVLLEPRYQVLLRRAEYSANSCSHDDNGTVFIADRVTLYDIYARQRCALLILMRKGALYV
jgi:hypothetical protein